MDVCFASKFDSKIDELFDNPDELTDYIVKCMPLLNEYYIGEKSVSKKSGPFDIQINKGIQKKDIYENYLVYVENSKGAHIDKVKQNKIECKSCKSINVFHDSVQSSQICRECGAMEFILGMEMTYKEEQENQEKTIVYSYKRDNHFNEWLSQFQAQEVTSIPPEVIIQLRSEFKKIKITNVNEITHAKVRTLLKKLKLNKYYEHVPYISNILNGIQPKRMPVTLEEKLRLMFKEIQAPFDKNCPVERKNFLSYSYVLYKFCELLSEDDYLECFPLLKSKEKLYQQDVIWKKICKDLEWEFIPTI
tara:strand:- start:761 stop:1675 length:915 start_codon:yes stop_codon:yes gene_type:complete